MFELSTEFSVKAGAAFVSNNLSVYHNKAKCITYIAYLGKEMVQFITWDEKAEKELLSETIPWEDLIGKEASGKNTSKNAFNATQVFVCTPSNRANPLILVLSTTNLFVIDSKNRKLIYSLPTVDTADSQSQQSKNSKNKTVSKACPFTRGLTCVDNLLVAGTNTGEIIQVVCTGETTFQAKKNLKEHTAPITDLATCAFDLITASADVAGNVVVWSKNMKSVMKKLSTGQPLSVVNVLRKQVFCGNLLGQIIVYHIPTGQLIAEMNAHCRQITALAVAPESAYIMTASEDTYVRVWKLHSRDPQQYKIEYRFAQRFENTSIMGANFTSTRGSGFLVSSYENQKLISYRIARKPMTENTANVDNQTLGQVGIMIS